MDATDLCFTPATELARLIRDRAISQSRSLRRYWRASSG